ncbi:hypothetical protein SAMN06295987_104114 [Novosphingobium mathurense]|uniref:Uncharacterized protein n=1 Tax=Novosphingobium mathurense TaxID=428990 RepID=A0A1U6I3J4_9SPHN|nr:hypothetical protein SAMN06295987_104114 [Novosphingobium mathurense]
MAFATSLHGEIISSFGCNLDFLYSFLAIISRIAFKHRGWATLFQDLLKWLKKNY